MKLVLTNAVYFKAHWSEPFKDTNTREAPFFGADGQAPCVPLMRRVGRGVGHGRSLSTSLSGPIREPPSEQHDVGVRGRV
jgi:serine protease inhibitor